MGTQKNPFNAQACMSLGCSYEPWVLNNAIGIKIIIAVTCDFQQCGILTSVDSDEPVQPPIKLRNSK